MRDREKAAILRKEREAIRPLVCILCKHGIPLEGYAHVVKTKEEDVSGLFVECQAKKILERPL